jgi:hypothetical protein
MRVAKGTSNSLLSAFILAKRPASEADDNGNAMANDRENAATKKPGHK